MKTKIKLILIIILICGLSNIIIAQEVDNPQEEFIENTWYLTKIEIGGEDHVFESNEETEWTTLTIDQIENQTNFYLDYCSGASGYGLIFTAQSSFIVDDFVISLIECEDPVNNSYKLMYFEIFEENANHEFDVVITMENDHKNLIVITQDNSHLYYQNVPNMSVEDHQQNNLLVYPNPAKDFIQIENLTEQANLKIYDLLGKQIFQQEIHSSDESLDVSNLSNGLYFYSIFQNGKSVKTGKLVKE